MTTRGIREGEVDGKDYYFVSEEEFLRQVEAGNLLEYARFVGNYYGTPLDKVQKELEEGNEVTHILGQFFNSLERGLNKTLWHEQPKKRDFEHWFALKYASFKENAGFIGRSLSYGLILFCIGLCVTLIYLLVSTVL